MSWCHDVFTSCRKIMWCVKSYYVRPSSQKFTHDICILAVRRGPISDTPPSLDENFLEPDRILSLIIQKSSEDDPSLADYWISKQQNSNYCTPCILYTVPIEGMNRLAKLWRKEKKRVRARSLLRCSAMWMKNQVAVVWMYDRLAFRGEKARLCIVDDDSTVSTSLRSLLL